MADQARRRRVEERIQTTVARLLERRVKDPRIGFTTITDCRVTGDLQHATVFYTVFGDEKQREKTAKALNSAKGLIRSEVGKALGIRLTPSIEFTLDALPQQTASFEETLASALDVYKRQVINAANAVTDVVSLGFTQAQQRLNSPKS